MKWTLIELPREIDKPTILAKISKPFLLTDRTKRRSERIIEDLNNTLNHFDLTNIYRTLNPIKAKNIFFSSAHRTFNKIKHILGHKTSLNKLKRIGVLQSTFSNSEIKLENSNRKMSGKFPEHIKIRYNTSK